MSSSTTSQVIPGTKNLAKMCIEQGKKAPRPDTETGAHVDIYQYSLQHGGGIAYLYVNETNDKTLEEEIEFQLVGLELEENPGETTIEIKVLPGQQRMVKLRSTEGPWKISTGVSYAIY